MIEAKWFNPGGTQPTVGIVYKKDEGGERCYIGCGQGHSEEQDIKGILAWGAKFPIEDGKKLLGVKEPKPEPVKEVETGLFYINHWDTFDNDNFIVDNAPTFDAALKKLEERYQGRLRPAGADRVEIRDSKGNIMYTNNVC